uniref:Uncharacterized protein n=1 Tax=Heterorhabditis bacteriophora TaxID=37862 RepID=A0A1I7WM40_HETBA
MSPHPGLPAPPASIVNHPPNFLNGQSKSPSDIAEYAMRLVMKKTQTYFVFVFLLVLGSRIGTVGRFALFDL